MNTSILLAPMRRLPVLLCVALVSGCGNSSTATPRPALLTPVSTASNAPVEIKSLSNRADLLSGGDALIELLLPADTPLSALKIDVEGRDVSSTFALRSNGRVQGLVIGLKIGDNQLTARRRDGSGARLTISNHPVGGPVFAGTQVQPWVCSTDSNGLGVAQDAQCNAPAVFSYFYRPVGQETFSAYDPKSPPTDVAMTTTLDGKTVPYIVRRERGTMDRGIYDIAVLADPKKEITPWAPPMAWNGRVVVAFDGGAASKHVQLPPGTVLNDHALSNGFMVIANGLHVNGNNANNNVSAEALMMLKEHVIEAYGPIVRTIGEGCSGGSLQQHLIASMYPGLLDGLLPTCSYPELWTAMQDVFDCTSLLNYYDNLSPQLWGAVAQRALVDGHANHSVCLSWEALFASRLNPSFATGCGLPQEQVYDAKTNPSGPRCTIQDYQKAILGLRPQDGFAKRPLDNVGVQYGLQALKAGTIVAEQFVDLNEKIGSKDIDGISVPMRTEADPGVLAIAYRTAQISDARKLAKVPIIDLRGHDGEEIHTDYNSYALRARLDRDNGHHDNQIIFTGPLPLFGDLAFSCGANLTTAGVPDQPDNACTHSPLLLMNRWLDAIAADRSGDPQAVKVVRNKPKDAVDTCFIGGQPVTDKALCAAAYPYCGSPRLAAGAPPAHDVLKCALKPLSQSDYAAGTFSDAQWRRLQKVFPQGVCDWSKPGIDQQVSVPWMSFADGPGGRPLGPAPGSVVMPASH